MSPGFPEWYQKDQACTISIDGEWTGSKHIDAFETESHFDKLTINGVEYSGDLSHVQMEGLEGMVPVGNIMWTSDYWMSSLGWRICRLPPVTSSPWSAENWSCTLDGSPCLPFANTRSGSILRLHTDVFHDADGNGSTHNGHPWCEVNEQFDTRCGPCSCGAGEQQSSQMLKLFNHVDTLAALARQTRAHLARQASSRRALVPPRAKHATKAATPPLREAQRAVFVLLASSATNWAISCATVAVEGLHRQVDQRRLLNVCPGSFGSREGQTSCEECETDHFSISESQTACASCYEVLNPGGPNRDLWVTMERVQWEGQLEWANMLGARDVTSCGCAEGACLSLASECFKCSEGMVCGGMGVVELEAGYFATFDNAGSVWRCLGDDSGRCPGGMPGSCATSSEHKHRVWRVRAGHKENDDGPM